MGKKLLVMVVAGAVIGLSGMTMLWGQAAGGEASLTVSVPAAVESTIKVEAAGGKILDVRREKEDGHTRYIATVQSGKLEYAMVVMEDGKFARKELIGQEDTHKTILFADAPEAVKKTLTKEADDAKIAEVVREEARTTYTAEYTVGKNRYWVQVGSDGTLLTKERADVEEEKRELP